MNANHEAWKQREAKRVSIWREPCPFCFGGYVATGTQADYTYERLERCVACAGSGLITVEREQS